MRCRKSNLFDTCTHLIRQQFKIRHARSFEMMIMEGGSGQCQQYPSIELWIQVTPTAQMHPWVRRNPGISLQKA